MKLSGITSTILLASAIAVDATPAIATIEEPVKTPTTKALAARQTESVTLIWKLTSTDIMNLSLAIGAIATGIAQLVTAFSSGTSGCTIQAETVTVNSRDVSDDTSDYDYDYDYNSTSVEEYNGTVVYINNMTAVSDHLMSQGYDVDENLWSITFPEDDSSNATYSYMSELTNNITVLNNLSFNSSHLNFSVRAYDDYVNSTSLAERYTYDKKEVYVMYHASGKCYTTHSTTQVATGIKKIIKRIDNKSMYASCWKLRFGSGSWFGHLKILGVNSAGYHSSKGAVKSCTW